MKSITPPSAIEQRVAVAFSAAKSAASSSATLAAALFFSCFGGMAVVLVPAIAFVSVISSFACYVLRASES